MYSSKAVVTASFLVRWPPIRRASSMSLSSIARLVGMCIVLHINMCSASSLGPQKTRGRFPVPWSLTDCVNVPDKSYCTWSSSTPSPACTSSMEKMTIPVAVVGVPPITTISPMDRRMEGYGLLLGKRYCRISGVDAIAGVFDLCNRGLAAGVDNPHSSHFLVRLSRLFQHFPLSREHFILVDIAKSAHNLIFSPRSVARALHIDHVAPDKLRRGGRLQTTGNEVGVRQDLFSDETGTVQIRIGGSLHAFGGKGRRSRGSALRGVGRSTVSSRLRPCRSREQQQEQSCFLHVTSGKDRAAPPPLVKCHKRKASAGR